MLARDVRGYLELGVSVAPGDVVVDVGANIGLCALHLLRQTAGELRVVCVEPVPEIRRVLERNLAATTAAVVPWAIARAPGRVDITYYPRAPGTSTAHPPSPANDDWPAVVRAATVADPRFAGLARLLPDAVFRLAARVLRAGARTVACEGHTMSELIASERLDRIDLLKLDVEGAEVDALAGISPDDWPKIAQIVAEVHDGPRDFETVTSLLAARGLTVQHVAPVDPASRIRCRTLSARRPERDGRAVR